MTPQMQLTLSSIFDGKKIRATEINGEIWIPVVDLADAWEVDRTTLTKIINRNPEIFKTLSTVIELPSSKEISSVSQSVNNSLRLVNERGSVILALKVSAKDLKNPIAKEKVIEFQLWVPQLMQDLRKGVLQLAAPLQQSVQQQLLPVQSPVEILKEQFEMAKVIVDKTGMPKDTADIYAVTLAGELSGIDLHCYASAIRAKAAPQPLQITEGIPNDKADYERHFSLRKVAEDFVHKPENEVRMKLEDLRIIYRENNMWKLTAEGEKYGKVFFVTPGAPYNMTRRPFIKYNDKLVQLLRDYYNVKVPVAKVSEV